MRFKASIIDETLLPRLRSGVIGLGVKLSAAVLSLLMFTMLARTLSLEDFGVVGFAFSLATLMAIAGSLGQRMYSLKRSAIIFEAGDKTQLSVLAASGIATVVTGTMAAALVFLAAYFFGLVELTTEVAVLTCFMAMAIALAEYLSHFLRGFRSIAYALIPRDIIWRLIVIATCTMILVGNDSISASTGILIITLPLFAIVVFQFFFDPATRNIIAEGRWRQAEIVRTADEAKHLWGTSLIQTVADPVLALVLLGLIIAPSDTGPLFAAFRIAIAMDLFALVAGLVVAPLVARYAVQSDTSGLQTVLSQASAVVFTATFIAFLAIVAFGDDILIFMNPEFAPGYPLLVIISLGYLVAVGCGPIQTILEVSGNERILFRWVVLLNSFGFACLVPAIYIFGMMGAAVGIAGIRVVLHLSLLKTVKTKLGVDPTIVGAVRLLLARERQP